MLTRNRIFPYPHPKANRKNKLFLELKETKHTFAKNIGTKFFAIMKKHILIALASFLLIGCTEQTPDIYFTENIRIYNPNKTQVPPLKGECIVNDLIGIANIEATGSYLCLFLMAQDTLLNIYSQDGKYLSGFGVKGQGPNDFIGCRPNGGREMGNGQACIWINDVGAAALKKVNIPLSMEKGCTVTQKVSTKAMSVNAFLSAGECLVQETMTPENFELSIYQGDEVLHREKMYRIDAQPPFSYYQSTIRLHSTQPLLVSAMFRINQINLLNLDTKERLSIRIGKHTALDNIIDKGETKLPKWTYYTDLRLTEDRIFALYLNQDYNDTLEKAKPVETHVFDLKGNLLHILGIDEYLRSFCVSEDGKTIYGLVEDHSIYKYQL